MQAEADALSEFDGPCALAAGLLQIEAVQKWVARSFPPILVDEAQDLDDHRMRILQGLSPSCRIVAAADAFQCLHNGRDTTPLWAGLKARAKHTASRWFGAQPSRAFWPPRWQCAKAGM